MVKDFIRLGASFLAEKLRWGGPTCLLYHRILPKSEINADYYFSGLSVSTESFEKQLAFLRSRMHPMRVSDLTLKDTIVDPKAVGVSLDDGYLDNLTHALPLLEKYEIPATIFVTPRLAQEPSLMWWFELEQRVHGSSGGSVRHANLTIEWNNSLQRKRQAVQRIDALCKSVSCVELKSLLEQLPLVGKIEYPKMLDPDQVSTLSLHPLIDIGAHALSHHVLAQLSDAEALQEIQGGLNELTRITGTKSKLFAYPYGGRGEITERDRKIGANSFEACYTTLPGHITQQTPFSSLPRINVDLTDNLSHLRWKLSGGYSFSAGRLRNVAALEDL